MPENTKILIGEVESVDISEEFAHEKLSPVLAMNRAKTFDEAIAKAEQLVATEDTVIHLPFSSILPRKRRFAKHAAAMKTCRVLIKHSVFPRRYRRPLQFQTCPRLLPLDCGSLGRKLRIRKRWGKTSSEYQDSCREEREYAVVQNTRKSIL